MRSDRFCSQRLSFVNGTELFVFAGRVLQPESAKACEAGEAARKSREVALLDVVRRTRFGNAKSQTWGTPCFVCRSPRQVDWWSHFWSHVQALMQEKAMIIHLVLIALMDVRRTDCLLDLRFSIFSTLSRDFMNTSILFAQKTSKHATSLITLAMSKMKNAFFIYIF